jgi:hypothetical protein
MGLSLSDELTGRQGVLQAGDGDPSFWRYSEIQRSSGTNRCGLRSILAANASTRARFGVQKLKPTALCPQRSRPRSSTKKLKEAGSRSSCAR